MAILKPEEDGIRVAQRCRERGMSDARFHKMRARLSDMDAPMEVRHKVQDLVGPAAWAR